MNKLLILMLAAGKGTRVKSLLTPEEPVKPMLRFGKNIRLFDLVAEPLKGLSGEKAVMIGDSPLYSVFENRARNRGFKVLKQKAKQGSGFPWIMLRQYWFSPDSAYLQSFDSIMTVCCDVVLDKADLEGTINLHFKKLKNPNDPQATLLTKQGRIEGSNPGLFLVENDRILYHWRYDVEESESYEVLTHTGVTILSRGILQKPWRALLGLRYNTLLRYSTQKDVTNYGEPSTVIKAREMLK